MRMMVDRLWRPTCSLPNWFLFKYTFEAEHMSPHSDLSWLIRQSVIRTFEKSEALLAARPALCLFPTGSRRSRRVSPKAVHSSGGFGR